MRVNWLDLPFHFWWRYAEARGWVDARFGAQYRRLLALWVNDGRPANVEEYICTDVLDLPPERGD